MTVLSLLVFTATKGRSAALGTKACPQGRTDVTHGGRDPRHRLRAATDPSATHRGLGRLRGSRAFFSALEPLGIGARSGTRPQSPGVPVRPGPLPDPGRSRSAGSPPGPGLLQGPAPARPRSRPGRDSAPRRHSRPAAPVEVIDDAEQHQRVHDHPVHGQLRHGARPARPGPARPRSLRPPAPAAGPTGAAPQPAPSPACSARGGAAPAGRGRRHLGKVRSPCSEGIGHGGTRQPPS